MKRLGGKRLGGKTTRGGMVWGQNVPDSCATADVHCLKIQPCKIVRLHQLYYKSVQERLKFLMVAKFGHSYSNSPAVFKEFNRCHNLRKQTRMDRIGLLWVPKRTGTDFSGYRNRLQLIRNKLQWEPEKVG